MIYYLVLSAFKLTAQVTLDADNGGLFVTPRLTAEVGLRPELTQWGGIILCFSV